jgi:hypothetical protein
MPSETLRPILDTLSDSPIVVVNDETSISPQLVSPLLTFPRDMKVDEDSYNSLCKKYLNWPRYFWFILFQRIVEASCVAEAKSINMSVPVGNRTLKKSDSALHTAFEIRKLRRLELQTRKRVMSSLINMDDFVRVISIAEAIVAVDENELGTVYPFGVLFTSSPSYLLINSILDRRANTINTIKSRNMRTLSPSSRFFSSSKRSPQVSPITRSVSSSSSRSFRKETLLIVPEQQVVRKRVTRADLAVLILALLDHHPDLKALRGSPLLVTRYCDIVSASLFASSGGACGQPILLSTVVRPNGIGESLWKAARTRLYKLPAFSKSEFLLVHTSFEKASRASRADDAVDNALGVATSFGVWSRIKVSFSRAVTRFSRLDKVDELPMSPRSPPFNSTIIQSDLSSKGTTVIDDPDPSADDAAYTTLPNFLRFFNPDITRLALERAFLGRGRELDSGVSGRMSFSDVCSLLAANVWKMKGDVATIDYWLRCCDIDEDGLLSFEDTLSCIEAKALHARWENLPEQIDTLSSIAALKELWPISKITSTGRISLSSRDIEKEKIGEPLFRLLISLSDSGLCEGK